MGHADISRTLYEYWQETVNQAARIQSQQPFQFNFVIHPKMLRESSLVTGNIHCARLRRKMNFLLQGRVPSHEAMMVI